ncbi:MAG: aquaporin [Nostoc sp.]|uniref:aquaporin n=1 Tax=Nostoc sp. TaxID=1180 RepID=UPI002FF5A489
MNPAVTLTFYHLGKVKRQDAVFYILFQCLGGLPGIYLVALAFGAEFTQSPIRYIVTVPGSLGWLGAVLGELAIAFIILFSICFLNKVVLLDQLKSALSKSLAC